MININTALNYYYSSYYGYGESTLLYLLSIAALILSVAASVKVNTTYSKFSKVMSRRGLTAEMVARRILDANGLYNVQISRVRGKLTDNFNPKTNVVSLSDSVYGNTSVAAIGVAAHEVGHAIQHANGYFAIKLRNSVLPIANIGSSAGILLFLVGMLFSFFKLMELGIILFSFVFIFQLITLPVEFNASGRALKILEMQNMLDDYELKCSKKVLTAAAMTYVASMLSSFIQLLRFISAARRNR